MAKAYSNYEKTGRKYRLTAPLKRIGKSYMTPRSMVLRRTCPCEELEEQSKPPEKVGSEVFQNIFKKAKHGVVDSRSWNWSRGRVKMEC